MKIEDLWQSIEKEEEEEKKSSFFIRCRGKIVQVAHTILYSFVKCIIISNC